MMRGKVVQGEETDETIRERRRNERREESVDKTNDIRRSGVGQEALCEIKHQMSFRYCLECFS